MNQGFTSLYESYLDDECKFKEYQKKRASRIVPICKVKIDEGDFDRTISITDDGRVFYIDHVQLGVIRRGRFVGDRWAYKVVSMAVVQMVKRYLELTRPYSRR